jgi:transcriptional regulator with XRE-family HTH domain
MVLQCYMDDSRRVTWTERNEELLQRLAHNVRRIRKEKGLVLEDVASKETAAEDEIGLSTWQRVESGEANPRLSTIAKIAEVLDVSPLELFI